MHFNSNLIYALNFLTIVFFFSLRSEAKEINFLIDTEKQKSGKQDCWIAEDKGRHLIASFMSTLFFAKCSEHIYNTSVSDSKIIGASFSITFGLAKEIKDHYKKNNKFSWKDMTANLVGIGCAIFLLGFD